MTEPKLFRWIMLYYSEEQDCPSQPASTLLEGPDDPAALLKLVEELWTGRDAEDGPLTISDKTEWGDYVIDGGLLYLFLTKVDDGGE